MDHQDIKKSPHKIYNYRESIKNNLQATNMAAKIQDGRHRRESAEMCSAHSKYGH